MSTAETHSGRQREDGEGKKEKRLNQRDGEHRAGTCHFAANRRKAEAEVTDCEVAAVQTDDPASWD